MISEEEDLGATFTRLERRGTGAELAHACGVMLAYFDRRLKALEGAQHQRSGAVDVHKCAREIRSVVSAIGELKSDLLAAARLTLLKIADELDGKFTDAPGAIYQQPAKPRFVIEQRGEGHTFEGYYVFDNQSPIAPSGKPMAEAVFYSRPDAEEFVKALELVTKVKENSR